MDVGFGLYRGSAHCQHVPCRVVERGLRRVVHASDVCAEQR
jgi:hypothetical protein